MRINELRLCKYKRFKLNQIDNFIFTPTKMVQLILGTNGSGKSSLIRELSPMPSDPNSYAKDGYKIISITNNNNSYILKSTFNPVARHSFEKNGVELNQGGTVTVFKELIKQEFGVTQEIHDLALGLELFHLMSPARKREWFIKLSDVNFEYALTIYNSLKERSRDISGALKLARKRLVTESAKVISKEEEDKLRHDVELTLRELNLLIEQSAPLDRPVSDYAKEQEVLSNELGLLSNVLLRLKCVAPYGTYPYGINPNSIPQRDDNGELINYGFGSINDLDNYIGVINREITIKETLINKDVLEHTKINDTIGILIKTGEEGIKPLHDKIDVLTKQRENVLKNIKLNLDVSDAQNTLNALDSVYDLLVSIFLAIPENSDKRYSQLKLQEYQNKLLEHRDVKNKLTSELAKLEATKVHLTTHKANGNVECPQCHHVWIIGYSDEKFNSLLLDIEEAIKLIDINNKHIADIEVEINAINEYGSLYRSFISCVRNWPILQQLWDKLINEEYVTRSPRSIPSIIDSFRIDLEHEISANKLVVECNELQELIKSAEKVGNANLFDMKLKLEIVSNQISSLTAELSKLQTSLVDYNKYRKQLIEADELGKKIKLVVSNITKVNSDMVEMLRRETLNHCVRQLQSALALKETTLSSIMLQKGIIEDLEKQIEKYTVENEAVDILIKELSPTTGIIADGLMGFIKLFVNQMNSLIKKIWSYPLQVLDCAISESENSELDFKFPLIVGTKDNVVSDVKFGSKGMQEIIDLSFRITAMKYLGLSNNPLFLDEYSASFDVTHRASAMNAIKTLTDTSSFSNLFIVSHDYSAYGIFNNAEICVLDSRNISIPSTYNEHVVME